MQKDLLNKWATPCSTKWVHHDVGNQKKHCQTEIRLYVGP